MTSASTNECGGRSISTTAPTGAGNPATAAARPSVRTIPPVIAVGIIESSCAAKRVITYGLAKQLLRDVGELRFKLLIERAKFGIDTAAARRDGRIAHYSHGPEAGQLVLELFDLLSEGGVIVWMKSQHNLGIVS